MNRNTLPPFLRRAAFGLLVTLMTTILAVGQTSTTSGAIRGTVTDPQGAVLATATVTITSQGTAAVRTASTDQGGQYTVGLLPPEVYTMTIAAPGFKTDNLAPVTVIGDGDRSRRCANGVGQSERDGRGDFAASSATGGERDLRYGCRWYR